jgi:hypothetical protein
MESVRYLKLALGSQKLSTNNLPNNNAISTPNKTNGMNGGNLV